MLIASLYSDDQSQEFGIFRAVEYRLKPLTVVVVGPLALDLRHFGGHYGSPKMLPELLLLLLPFEYSLSLSVAIVLKFFDVPQFITTSQKVFFFHQLFSSSLNDAW